jgi:hypothetical protein
MVQHVEECPTFHKSLFDYNLPSFQEQEFPSNSQENLNCQSQPQVSTNQDNSEHQTIFFFSSSRSQ